VCGGASAAQHTDLHHDFKELRSASACKPQSVSIRCSRFERPAREQHPVGFDQFLGWLATLRDAHAARRGLVPPDQRQ